MVTSHKGDLRIANNVSSNNQAISRDVIFTSPSTITLNQFSSGVYIFENGVSGQIINMGTASGYIKPGQLFTFINKSSNSVAFVNNSSSLLKTLPAYASAMAVLQDKTTSDGVWAFVDLSADVIDPTNPTFAGLKVGFEDFLFGAYAGAGGNDNQYSFLPEDNSGDSDIDGAVSVVGNDYEGIHTLNSLASTSARPLVNAFNAVNRIKLGAQAESFEVRVRIDTLADINQKFTTRYGLMDVSTVGQPANGVFFSYVPTYPVTGVPQVVTVTPDTSSHAPYQTFTETITGVPYTYNFSTFQQLTVTPNTFPVAMYQKISVTWTRTNNFTYTLTINGTVCSYTSDASATDAEIALGLGNAINAAVGSAVIATTTGKPITVTSKILGTGFTYSTGASVTAALITANVPIAVYTQIINGVSYVYTSDGTPTALEVCNGLRALMASDSTVNVSGTTTLVATAKIAGVAFTFSGTPNLTESDTTPNPVATTIVTSLKSLINAGGLVVATGTGTLILTGDSIGTPFTYSGTANLVQVLTTSPVQQVVYRGNWIANVVNSSSATPLESTVAVVPGQWYRLKMAMNSNGSAVYCYIDDAPIGSIVTPLPLVALRYVFKLEKTAGTSPRSTAIDYITWRRDRG